MNWEAIGAIGEMIGALGVIASIIYLATQIRQNTVVARSSMRHNITGSAIVGGKALAENERLALLLQRRNREELLEPHEELRLQALAFTVMRNWEDVHYQYRCGMLTESEWAAFRENLRALMQNRLWADYWGRERDIYTESFRNEVETILSEVETGKAAAVRSALHGKG